MQELTFTIQPEEDGGYVAKSKLEKGSIITQGDDIKELKAMILDAIEGYFWDKPNEKEQLFYREIDAETGTFKGKPVKMLSIKGKVTGSMIAAGFYRFKVTDKFDIHACPIPEKTG